MKQDMQVLAMTLVAFNLVIIGILMGVSASTAAITGNVIMLFLGVLMLVCSFRK